MAKTYCHLAQRRPIQSLPFSPNISVPFNPCPVHETRVPLVDSGISISWRRASDSESDSDSDSLLVLLSFQPSSKFRGGGVSDYYFVWRRVVMPFYPGQDP